MASFGVSNYPRFVVIHSVKITKFYSHEFFDIFISFSGFTINRICAASLFTLAKTAPKVPLNTRKWLTTFVGLGVIPFIIHPIDSLVHYGMDNTTRKWIGGVDVKLD